MYEQAIPEMLVYPEEYQTFKLLWLNPWSDWALSSISKMFYSFNVND